MILRIEVMIKAWAPMEKNDFCFAYKLHIHVS